MSAIEEVLHHGTLITKAKKALILLHGRGGTAKSMLPLSDMLCDSQYYIAAPQAKNNIWYPHSFMEEDSLNEPNLSFSIQEIKDLIDKTADHIAKDQIFIAGFSQGACLALEVSSRFGTKYGGIIAFTGGLIGHEINESKYQGNFDGTKVFISNGDNDPHIPLRRSEESKKMMEKLGAKVTLKTYEGRGHTISEDEINYVKAHILLTLES